MWLVLDHRPHCQGQGVLYVWRSPQRQKHNDKNGKYYRGHQQQMVLIPSISLAEANLYLLWSLGFLTHQTASLPLGSQPPKPEAAPRKGLQRCGGTQQGSRELAPARGCASWKFAGQGGCLRWNLARTLGWAKKSSPWDKRFQLSLGCCSQLHPAQQQHLLGILQLYKSLCL